MFMTFCYELQVIHMIVIIAGGAQDLEWQIAYDRRGSEERNNTNTHTLTHTRSHTHTENADNAALCHFTPKERKSVAVEQKRGWKKKEEERKRKTTQKKTKTRCGTGEEWR